MILLAAAAQLALVSGFRNCFSGLFFGRRLWKWDRRLLDGAFHRDDTIARPRNTTFNQDDVLVGENLHDAEVQNGRLLVAVLAGHLLPTRRSTWRGSHTDRTATALGLVRAVSNRARACEVVALHHTREPATFARSRDVDELAVLKDVGWADGLTYIEPFEERLIDAELANDPRCVDANLLEGTSLGLVHELLATAAEAELERGVAVFRWSALAQDHAGPCLDRSDASDLPVLEEDLGVAKLGADEAGIRIHKCSPREKGRKDSDARWRVKADAFRRAKPRLLLDSKYSDGVFVAGLGEGFWVFPAELRDAGRRMGYICGFIAFSTPGNRSQVGGVRLDQ